MRIIPAYAGQISQHRRFSYFVRDHPRIRGTNIKETRVPTLTPGSSPHTRDKLMGVFCLIAAVRIIPAYAGQISEYIQLVWRYEDHPRIRGTNIARAAISASVGGSSPHTRDKFVQNLFHRCFFGIIPAYAGQI